MRKIEHLIRKFVKEIDPKIRVVFVDDEMASMPTKNIILIRKDEFLYVYDDEILHKQVLKEKGMLLDIMIPTFTVLHEIGHIKSIEKMHTKHALLRQYENQANKIVPRLLTVDDLRKYKNLKIEKMADEFAYNYYLHNYEKVKKFNDTILDLLN